MKKILLLIIMGTCLHSMPAFSSSETDSVYLFAYANARNAGRDGLHFAWSSDGNDWHAIGNGSALVKSDYGRWGSEKRMLEPFLFQDENGLWQCVWFLTPEGDFAHVASPDLISWGRQTYYSVQDANIDDFTGRKRSYTMAQVDGKVLSGTVLRIEQDVVTALVNDRQSADLRQKLYAENTKDDSLRFAGLKPFVISIKPDIRLKKKISDMLIGIFFEDINYAADGGLYGELVQNRSFEYLVSDKEGRDKDWNAAKAWALNGNSDLPIDTAIPVHPVNKHYVILKKGDKLVNEGFDGIALKAGDRYRFSVFARPAGKKGKPFPRVDVYLTDQSGKVISDRIVLTTSGASDDRYWQKYEDMLTANQTTANARLEIHVQRGEPALDMISLFPEKTFKERKNGLRADLAQTIADIHPRFVRFPGGCVAHGDGLENMYRWKNTVGPLETRKSQRNIWRYHQSFGLGYYEYFQFCEDIGAEPLPVVAAGVPCQNSDRHGHKLGGQQCGIPMEQMGDYIQEVLDLIEWANGDASTTWGKVRAEAGHPEPFKLRYVGVGNEDLISDIFEERFTLIYKAVKEKYPEITVIGTVGPFNEGTDYTEGWKIARKLDVPMVDEHYYQSPGWFIHNQDFYDRYPRQGTKVYLGEYAAHLPGRPNNIETALTEALHIINLERNGDVVSMASYAPLLAKEGFTQWNPDLIYFNNTEVKPAVGYYVQQMCGQNSGDQYIPVFIGVPDVTDAVRKRVAVSLVQDSKSGDLIMKVVNLLPVDVRTDVDMAGIIPAASLAERIVLTGKPGDRKAEPVADSIDVSGRFEVTLPAYSFTLIRIKTE